MSDPVDYYDVQNMIRDAITSARAEWEASIRDLRSYVDDETRELRDDVRSLERVVASRTEHLA